MNASELKATCVALIALLATGCALAPRPPAPAEAPAPSGFPAAWYRAAAARSEPVLVVDPADGQSVLMHVYRAGSLAALGHDHAVSAPAVRGCVLLSRDRSAARADLYLPLESLAVDAPPARREAGLKGELDEDDIDATREHMRDAVLESARYPYLVVHAVCAAGHPDCARLKARITLHGVTRSIEMPVVLRIHGGRALVSGRFSVLQSEFGMTPYSVLGGALRVQDWIDVDFALHARAIRPPAG
jgi:polyisoprenoid-binding protein YceI